MNNEQKRSEIREEVSEILRQEKHDKGAEQVLRALEVHRDATHQRADAASRGVWAVKQRPVWWKRWQYSAIGAGLATATVLMMAWFSSSDVPVETSVISVEEAAAYLGTSGTSIHLDEEAIDETETDLLIATLSAADDATSDWILTTNDVTPLFSEYNDGN